MLDELDQYMMGALIKQYDTQHREDLYMMRWQTFMLLQPHTDKLHKPQDLVLFSWESVEEIPPEEIEARKQQLLNIINK